VIDRLEWVFVSDPATLDGASGGELRRRFVAWRDEARVRENRSGEGVVGKKWEEGYSPPRYSYFVEVDEECLRVSGDDVNVDDNLDAGWVRLVRVWDEEVVARMRLEEAQHKLRAARWRREQGLPIREVDEEDEDVADDWITIATYLLGPELYGSLTWTSGDDQWYMYNHDRGSCKTDILMDV
jgi:hypothetical protein